MKKYHILVFAGIFTLLFGTLAVGADLQNSFMEYKWGEDISQYRGLTLLHAKGDVTYYSHPGELYTIDDVQIDKIIFGFYKGDFFAVYVGIDSLETYDTILMYMKSKYGLPSTKLSSKDHLTTNKWKYKDVIIKLKTDEIGGKMKLAIYYKPISRDLRKDQLEVIDEASFQFFPIDKNEKPKMMPFLKF